MVKSITEKCSAKINIAIDVLGKYPNGYHEVRMIMTQVGIFDVITISLKDEKGIEVPSIMVNSLEEAVIKAKEIAKEGDIITLSPACASFDMFPNFAVRGNKFKEIVNNI